MAKDFDDEHVSTNPYGIEVSRPFRKYSMSRPSVQFGKKVSPGRKNTMLKALAQGASVSAAAASAGTTRATAFRWRKADPEFAKAWADAVEEGTDLLEEEAVRRAVDGVQVPIYYKGEVCGVVFEKSDRLLEFMLKARRPQVYGDKIDHNHTLNPVTTITRRIVDVDGRTVKLNTDSDDTDD